MTNQLQSSHFREATDFFLQINVFFVIFSHPIRLIINWRYQRPTCRTAAGDKNARQPLRQETAAHCHPLLPDAHARHCQTLCDISYWMFFQASRWVELPKLKLLTKPLNQGWLKNPASYTTYSYNSDGTWYFYRLSLSAVYVMEGFKNPSHGMRS